MMIIFFSDLHINETAQFSTTTDTGFSVRQQEAITCAREIADMTQRWTPKAVVYGGDFIHRVGNQMSVSDLATLDMVISIIQEECIKQDIIFYILIGNHDVSSSMAGFHKLLSYKGHENIKIIDNFECIGDYVFMSYNYDDEAANIFLEGIPDKEKKIVFSHLEIKDWDIGNGIKTSRGASIHTLKKFKKVLQGHYHIPKSYADNIIVAGSCHKTSFKDPGGGSMILYNDDEDTYARVVFNVPSWYTFDDETIAGVKELSFNNYVKVMISSENVLKANGITKEFLYNFKGSEIVIDVRKISGKKLQREDDGSNVETEEEMLHKFIELAKVPEDDKQTITEIGLDLINRARG